jgi:hypothetical protein
MRLESHTTTIIELSFACRQPQNTGGQNAGGQFTPDQQTDLRLLINSVNQLLLQNPDCAKVLGGTKNAQAVLNRANVRSANTINPNYRGTGGRYPGVAGRANSPPLIQIATTLPIRKLVCRGSPPPTSILTIASLRRSVF